MRLLFLDSCSAFRSMKIYLLSTKPGSPTIKFFLQPPVRLENLSVAPILAANHSE